MKRKERNTLESVVSSLCYDLDNITWTRYGSDFLALNVKEEKRHRASFSGRSYPRDFRVIDAARIFFIKALVEQAYHVSPADYLSIKESILRAVALVNDSRTAPKIKDWVSRNEGFISKILNVDYAKEVRSESNQQTEARV